MIINKYLLLIFTFGMIVIQGTEYERETIEDSFERALSMDEAYLILKNENYPDNAVLFGNEIVCESCNLTHLLHANNNSSDIRIIRSTKYAYDLEVHAELLNGTLLCRKSAYKFEEHGTYVLDVKWLATNEVNCTITQIGDPSNYWTPAILGIVFVILYTIVVQIAYQLYYGRCSSYFRGRILRQGMINDDAESIIQIPGRNPGENVTDILNVNIRSVTGTSLLPSTSSAYSYNNRTQNAKSSSKRLRALDTFRGFALMVMIFVNYGGMSCLSNLEVCSLFVSRWWLLVF